MSEYKLSYTAEDINNRLGEIDNVVKYTPQDLTDGQKAQARTNIGAVSMEEVEELLGIEEEFSVSGEVVEFNVDVDEGTELQVISKIHRDETWGPSDKLVLHQVSGNNFVDLSAWLGGVGTVFEKNGVTATINDDSTMTVRGTNEGTSYTSIIKQYLWSGEHSEKVYPAGTYTIPKGFTIAVRKAQYPENVVISGVGNLSNTVTIPEPFRIIYMEYGVKAGVTVDLTLPLGLFRGDSVPETGYEYNGQLHTVTFNSPVYEGEFNWSTGELKDADGNVIGAYEPPEIKRLPGTNYFWTCFGENTVSNVPNDLGKAILRLNEAAPAETVASICDFTITPTTPHAVYCLHDAKVRNGGVFFGHEIPLVTTKGTLSVVDPSGAVTTEKYIDALINWRGTSDYLTNKGVRKAWSGKFYFTKEPIAQEDFSDINNALYTFEFSEEDFQNVGLPAKLDNIPIVSPCFYTEEDATSKLNERVWGGGQFPATLSWDASSGKYIFKVRGLYPGNIMAQLTRYTKCYFHYQLETPYDVDTTFAMGISGGDAVKFTVDDSDWKTYLDGELYQDSASIDAMPTGLAYIPRNAVDACDGMINAARMLNNTGNASGDATVQGYSWIGEGDGNTDYTSKIQSKLDVLHSVSDGGTIYLGPGTYKISNSLIVYGNTRIIGDGKTVIEQTADNTHALVLCGSNITIEDLSLRLSGRCTKITGCVYVNSYNKPSTDGYNSAFPETGHIKGLTMNNVSMSGEYKFGSENGYPVISDAYENYMGVGICCDRTYFTYAHVDNVHFNYLHSGVYGGGGSNYFNVTAEFCKYGLYVPGAGDNTYFVNGHSHYAVDENGKHISMSDAIAYVESDATSTYHLRVYDVQAVKKLAYFGPRTRMNKIDVQIVGSLESDHEWGILTWLVDDYGSKNVISDLYKTPTFQIGSQTASITESYEMKLCDPVIQNALSGAGVWGNISSNVEFESYGIALRDVCRYPSEKAVNNRLPYILSSAAPTEENPIEIIIDYSNRPVPGIPNYFIQFHHQYVATDYVVSFDTTNTGVYSFEIPVTGNTNVTEFCNEPQIGQQYVTYRMKLSFTKPLKIPNLEYALVTGSFNYNPNGLIGICNIGMTVNDYAGRSFLGECGGSLYGNVDMHQNTLKNLPNPIDAGDAVSKAYLEESLADIESALDAIIVIQNELIGGDDV